MTDLRIKNSNYYYCTVCGLRSGTGSPNCKGCYETMGWCNEKTANHNHAKCEGQVGGRPLGTCTCSCHLPIPDEDIERVKEGLARMTQPKNGIVMNNAELRDMVNRLALEEHECSGCGSSPPFSLNLSKLITFTFDGKNATRTAPTWNFGENPELLVTCKGCGSTERLSIEESLAVLSIANQMENSVESGETSCDPS